MEIKLGTKTIKVTEIDTPKEIKWSDGFPEILNDKSIKEQAKHFRIAMSSNHVWSSYGQIDNEKFHQHTYAFENYSNPFEVLYDGKYIVGIRVYGNNVYVNDGGCVYIGEDNNGAGYKTYYEYAYLCCAPTEENK